jgi:hypothetical protein
MREHRLNVSENVIDLSSGSLFDSGTDGPDETEYEPLLNVELVGLMLLFLTLC